ncbi:MAG: hypothetical protein ACM3XM_19685 [Mycobacterium leprae]
MTQLPVKNPVERDLRHLSNADLVSLIQSDIKELDEIIRTKWKSGAKAPAKKGKAAPPELDLAEVEPERLPLFRVTCCNVTMGDFPAYARVRCKFCGEWHRAGDFPPV